MFGNSNLSPEVLMSLGGGILGGQNLAQGFGQGLQNASNVLAYQKQQTQQATAENATKAWLQKQYPDQDFSQLPPEMVKTIAQETLKNRYAKPDLPALAQEYNFAKQNGFNGSFMEYQQAKSGMDGSGKPELGLSPQYGVDANGNPVLLQLSKDGRVVQPTLPDGVKLSKEPIKLDAGTHFVLLDPITRQPVGTIPKNLAETEKQKVLGENEGKQTAAAQGDLQAGQNAKDLINSIRSDPNRTWGTGVSSVFNSVPSSPGYDFQRKVEQAKSGAFLTAIQQMRGLGALSNAEGQTATAAVTRMDTATSEQEFLSALADYEKIIDQGIARAKNRLPNATPNAVTNDSGVVDYKEFFK